MAQNLPSVTPNVNMVSGTRLGTGDPFLTKQNEPSIAVSSLNPAHILGGSNDSRLIDFSELSDIPGEQTADSWVSLYKSVDGGRTWRSAPLPGCPLNIPECNIPSSPAKGYRFASDPTIRSGPYGTFFYSFIAGNRGENAPGVLAVQRIIDRNDNLRVTDDPFYLDVTSVIAQGNAGQFKDKPWNAVDQPGRPWNNGNSCLLPGRTQPVPAFSVYVAYSNFVGDSPDNPHPQIYVARSHDCGATFEKPVKTSASVATNQGAVIGVDPIDGSVYVAWRQFFTATNQTPHGIFIAKSTNGGKSFDPPVRIATIDPFDQGPSSSTRFRSNALPAMAVSVDRFGVSRVHVVWAERNKGPNPQGGGVRAARIMMSTSRNAALTNWTTPRAIDFAGASANNEFNPGGLGHQLQPALAFAGGRLAASWIDQRNDHTVGVLQLECPQTAPFYPCRYRERLTPMAGGDTVANVFTDWIIDTGLKRRHTLDIYAATAEPGEDPQFTSSRVSQYSYGSLPNPPGGCGPDARCPKQIRQLEFNPPNLPIYVNFTASFIGDYIDIGVRQFIPTPEDPKVPFKFNNSATNGEVFHTTWTDNRDVRAPKDSIWGNHQPVKLISASGATLVQNTSCIPGRESMKNQNVYIARIGESVNAFALVNSKLLSDKPRRFSIVVQNLTSSPQSYRLDAGSGFVQPSGALATFTASPAGPRTLLIAIPPNSSAHRTLWASSSTNPRASVEVRVYNSDGARLLTSVTLNPDPAGIFVTNTSGGPDQVANDMTELTENAIRTPRLTNNELINTELTNTELTNTELTNTELTNTELTNNELTNTELTNTELTNTELTNTELTNTELTNTELTNTELTNTELTNGSVTDATFVVTNKGNTDTVLNMKSIIRGVAGRDLPPGYKVQMVVHKLYITPRAAACSFGPAIQNVMSVNVPRVFSSDPASNLGEAKIEGDESEASVSLAVGDIARVTYRIVSNEGAALSSADFARFNVKSIPVGPDSTIIPVPLLILPLNLPPGVIAQSYGNFELSSRGGDSAASPSWSATGLPLGMTVDTLGGKGILSGTPQQTGRFTPKITVQQGLQTDHQLFELVINKATATVILSGLTATYDGSPKPVTVATTPAGLAAVVTYNGSAVAPSNAGTYSVLAVVSTSAYEGSATATLTIEKAAQSISFSPLSPKTFGDAPFTLSATATSGLPVVFRASGNCTVATRTVTLTGAGSCTISASQAGGDNWLPAEPVLQTFAIAKAAATLTLSGLTQPFNGEPRIVTVTTSPAGLDAVSVTYNGASTPPSQVGSYAVVASLSNPNYAGSATGTLTIVPVALVPGPAGSMSTERMNHSATLLTTGEVLIAGGANLQGSSTATAELYNPVTKSFTPTSNNMPNRASGHTSTRLVDGRVLIAGGGNASAEVYNRATNSFASTGGMSSQRSFHTATLLRDGRVLIAGGVGTNGKVTETATIFNPTTGSFADAGKMAQPRQLHTATLLPDGKVLIAGGRTGTTDVSANAELYDPATGLFTSAGNMRNPRAGHQAVLLPSGDVVLLGGSNGTSTLNTMEIYSAATKKFAPFGTAMLAARELFTAVLRRDGSIHSIGGASAANVLNSSEVLAGSIVLAGEAMGTARSQHTATVLADGSILVTGGRNGSGAAIRTTELYVTQ